MIFLNILYCCFRFYCLFENVIVGILIFGYFDCSVGYYCSSGIGLDWKSCFKGIYS